MHELVLVGKTVALVCSLAGLYFTVKPSTRSPRWPGTERRPSCGSFRSSRSTARHVSAPSPRYSPE